MDGRVTLSIEAAEALVVEALVASNVNKQAARSVAKALVAAEVDGQYGHGLSRVPSYAAQAASGKVDGQAVPRLSQGANASFRIDAEYGFSYPAIDMAIDVMDEFARRNGIAIAAIHKSHHFGQAGAHVERLADKGFVAMMFGNSPKAMAFAGGKKASLGTNPIAFAAPVGDERSALVIDLALSQAARGKIVSAQRAGELIPEGWALDSDGRPTTDPNRALAGTMVPVGGVKGASLALMVEILSAALTGSHFGFEASSLFEPEGDTPNLGHVIIAIDPNLSSGGAFLERMAVIVDAMESEDGVRVPGSRRYDNRMQARRHGIGISESLYREIFALKEKVG